MSTLSKLANIEQDSKPDTKSVLTDLFKENTGKHLLDSGGAYGRNWEENQDIDDLEEEKSALTLDISVRDLEERKIEILPSVSTFHFLLQNAEYSDEAHELTRYFYNWAETGNSSRSWLTEMKEFMADHGEEQAATTNTYNHEFNNMDQILQFVPFNLKVAELAADGNPFVEELSSTPYSRFVLIQVHGGCDVRGGYTAPIVLEIDSSLLIMGASTLDLYCPECGEHRFSATEHELYEWKVPEMIDLMPLDRKDYREDTDMDQSVHRLDVDWFRCGKCGHELDFRCGGMLKEGTGSYDGEGVNDDL